MPTARADLDCARIDLSIEWTRRPEYAVVAQSAPNRLNNACLHWVVEREDDAAGGRSAERAQVMPAGEWRR